MSLNKTERRLKIRKRIRKKISGTAERPRLSVFRSNTSITAQLINDDKGFTLAFVSSRELSDAKSSNIKSATEVGKKLAEKAISLGISSVVFDRGGYLYHGKVKALAEGAREGGLKF